MAFESGAGPEDWKSVVTALLYKSKCNVRIIVISLLSGVGKIYPWILVERIRRVTGVLSDDEKGVSDQGGDV